MVRSRWVQALAIQKNSDGNNRSLNGSYLYVINLHCVYFFPVVSWKVSLHRRNTAANTVADILLRDEDVVIQAASVKCRTSDWPDDRSVDGSSPASVCSQVSKCPWARPWNLIGSQWAWQRRLFVCLNVFVCKKKKNPLCRPSPLLRSCCCTELDGMQPVYQFSSAPDRTQDLLALRRRCCPLHHCAFGTKNELI